MDQSQDIRLDSQVGSDHGRISPGLLGLRYLFPDHVLFGFLILWAIWLVLVLGINSFLQRLDLGFFRRSPPQVRHYYYPTSFGEEHNADTYLLYVGTRTCRTRRTGSDWDGPWLCFEREATWTIPRLVRGGEWRL